MLSVVGHDLNIYTATISPQERAILYLKMHRQLYVFIDEAKENVIYNIKVWFYIYFCINMMLEMLFFSFIFHAVYEFEFRSKTAASTAEQTTCLRHAN
jgi:hypothetical protein